MSLSTPDAIRTLRRKLYEKAKREPNYRFYLLYDKVWRADILRHAYELARANGGAPGVDGVTFERIEAEGLESWLERLGEELRTMTYRPKAVRRVMIPKPGGGERPLGIPTIRDRVAQTAAKLVVEPIFEADMDPAAFGYRPQRGATEAIQAVMVLLRQGYTDVVDADLSRYFDTVPHAELMTSIARRIVDGDMLRLIKLWLQSPVETTDGNGVKRMEGGKAVKRGVPQGGVVSPLLANLYMNRFTQALARKRMRRGLSGARRQLRGRLRDPQPRQSGGGSGMDGSGDDAARTDPEPKEDPTVRRAEGAVRLPGLQLRRPYLPADRAAISRRQPLQEERATSQGQGERDARARQCRPLGRGAKASQPPLARVGRLLQPRLALCRGRRHRRPCL